MDPLDGAFAPFAQLVFAQESFESVLQHVIDSAAEAIPGCSMASMTLLDRGGPSTPVATSAVAARIDLVQYQGDGGPCLHAYRHQTIVRIRSTEKHEIWREFCEGAFAAGVKSTLSLPLIVQGDGLGAVNLYSAVQDGFDNQDENIGSIFASLASATLTNARAYWKNEEIKQQLETALTTRGVIDQAKGILMAREGCDAEEAFDILKRASQRANRKLHELAQEIVERTGTDRSS